MSRDFANMIECFPPRSIVFDDIYFSADGGVEETNYVFLQGNRLTERFKKCEEFTIAETGFGTGLNFLCTYDLWRKKAPQSAKLKYISVEKYPIDKDNLANIYKNFPSLKIHSDLLLSKYPEITPGVHKIHFNNVEIVLIFADVVEGFNLIDFQADAWFLDGFAPAKNPEMWSEDVFRIIENKTKFNGTVATFTSARIVKDSLKKIGLSFKKKKGFGKKRDMLVAEKRLYRRYSDYLQEIIGHRAYKVCIDGGFSCPNRDGTKDSKGCIFCDASGSSSYTQHMYAPIREQVLNNIESRKKRYGAKKFIAYFQSYTNTYAPLDELKKKYDEAVFAHPDIAGLAISTRPDCVDREKLKLIASYKKHLPYVSIEYGMQTIHNKTLELINRHETHDDFLHALELTKEFDLDHCVHIILGLPGESIEDQIETARKLKELKVNGVKIHVLVAMKGTKLAENYFKGEWRPLDFDSHVSLICDFLENLHPECVIHRIAGNGHPSYVVAPDWICQDRSKTMAAVEAELVRRK